MKKEYDKGYWKKLITSKQIDIDWNSNSQSRASSNNTRDDLHMDITIRSILKSDWYSLGSQRWRSSIQPAKKKKRLGANCPSDHELLTAKFRLKLNKVGKITRPFRYDLNQIPYNCILEVINRFKGLDLIDRVSQELWAEVCDTV